MDEIELKRLMAEIGPLIAEINQGARMMDAETDEENKLSGSSVVNKAVSKIIEKGGIPLLREAYYNVAPECQRTVELQMSNVKDRQGRMWQA